MKSGIKEPSIMAPIAEWARYYSKKLKQDGVVGKLNKAGDPSCYCDCKDGTLTIVLHPSSGGLVYFPIGGTCSYGRQLPLIKLLLMVDAPLYRAAPDLLKMVQDMIAITYEQSERIGEVIKDIATYKEQQKKK